jgi:hypothetical protein
MSRGARPAVPCRVIANRGHGEAIWALVAAVSSGLYALRPTERTP